MVYDAGASVDSLGLVGSWLPLFPSAGGLVATGAGDVDASLASSARKATALTSSALPREPNSPSPLSLGPCSAWAREDGIVAAMGVVPGLDDTNSHGKSKDVVGSDGNVRAAGMSMKGGRSV